MTPKEVIQDYISRCDDALCGGSSDPYALMADDVNVRVQGRTFIAGDHPNLTIVKKVLVDVVAERVREAHLDIRREILEGCVGEY